MNENTVSLHISEANVLAIFALLSECMSGAVVSDLGLDPLWSALNEHFEMQDLVNATGFITKVVSDSPVQIVPRSQGRHTIIELI